ncbi:TonB-dependent receptor [Azospirillum picis]|uniref:Iron complex outermembrane receptor protein n=1 Tax=Azospirillum picis TaxID=488438 RepID=A0ABU0MSI4_9PROT|nr:TonB-dependent receptor [Azospirillum picis]MBP2302703.1 iron complex outermembrane receptor protein [Azospirillum picis]MDQ0536454.1 iron complex outermembrane receptor protein [Azospirillum picis]
MTSRFAAADALRAALLSGAALVGLPPAAALAQTVQSLPAISVVASPDEPPMLSGAALGGSGLAARRPATSDAAALLRGLPGVSLYGNGGVSSLPVLNGLAADRVNLLVDGAPIAPACPNQMNPAMSTLSPSRVSRLEVLAGITPVSVGGDSIAGTITVESAPPVFAAPGEAVHGEGSLSAVYRSNSHAVAGAATASVSDDMASLRYDGSWSRAGNYRAGDGRTVHSTLFNVQDNVLTFGARRDGHLVTLQGGLQTMPYQGFPTQRMDLTDNRSGFLNGRYEGSFDWGTLDARANWRRTRHTMNFLEDKGGTAGGGMPMDTLTTDAGYSVKASLPLSARDTLHIGNEFRHTRLDDWWDPVAGSMMMGPQTYWNVKGGTRNRIGTFAEWEAVWSPAWTTLLGLRNDVVWMDTGAVQPYSWRNPVGMGMMAMANPDAADARAFNARHHGRTDVNVDLTALARYTASDNAEIEAGYARKTRSPNLYERYAWGTGAMSSSMNGWFGDANGYAGDPDLKPEVAHTASATLALHDAARKSWEVKLTPYYSYVQDFIGVDRIGALGDGFAKLRFANHDAILFGANLSAAATVYDDERFGAVRLSGTVGWTQGRTLDTGDALYHMMPVNALLTAEHRLGGWSSAVELQLTARKERVEALRNEPQTPSYALVNLRTSYQWGNVRLDAGIENLLDRTYYPPLAGIGYADYRAGGRQGTAGPLAGPGRSFLAGLTVTF